MKTQSVTKTGWRRCSIWAAGAGLLLLAPLSVLAWPTNSFEIYPFPEDGSEGVITSPVNVPPGDNVPIEISTNRLRISAAAASGFVFDHWTETSPGGPYGTFDSTTATSTWYRPLTSATNQNIVVYAYFRRTGVPLTIISTNRTGVTVGNPQPFAGVQVLTYGTTVSSRVTSPHVIAADNERAVVQGWTRQGSDPASGGGGVMPNFTLTTDTTLRWSWITEFYLNVSVTGGGTVASSYPLPWVPAGTAVRLTAVEGADGFVQWSGTDGSFYTAVVTVLVDRAKSYTAVFRPGVADTDADGMPNDWEVAVGLDPMDGTPLGPNGRFGDPDGDGLLNISEYGIYQMLSNNLVLRGLVNPLNADADGDGMDDSYEFFHVGTGTNVAGGVTTNAPAVVTTTGMYGADGNPDQDFLWSTTTGYKTLNGLRNIDEYRGPDDQAPYTFAWQSVPGIAGLVKCAIPNPSDTFDQSNSDTTDSETSGGVVTGDGFDDGFEYSWDRWQRLFAGTNIVMFTNTLAEYYWPGITNTVPAWSSTRPFNPAVRHADHDPLYGPPDYDCWYSQISGAQGNYFTDLAEAYASEFATGSGTLYQVSRRNPPPGNPPWCTHPFMWDADGDGLPDGWEISFGYDPWDMNTDGTAPADGAENPDGDWFAQTGTGTNALRHHAVYVANGYHPQTGWFFKPPYNGGPNDQTKEFVNREELVGTNAAPSLLANDPADAATHPRSHDTDGDGIWDGWEWYVGLNPKVAADAAANPDGDGISNLEEFQSFHTSTNVQSARTFVPDWYNKSHPTDPNDRDTDYDQSFDGEEKEAFNISPSIVPGATPAWMGANANEIAQNAVNGWYGPITGGGLNPTTGDTDGDYLPDWWEQSFANSGYDTNGAPNPDGMDGTVSDYLEDPDGDGLRNYQEYLCGAVYHWQWLFNNGAQAWTGDRGLWEYDPFDFFNWTLSVSGRHPWTGDAMVGPGGHRCYAWDPRYWSNKLYGKVWTYLTAAETPLGWLFSTCWPDNPDTDNDGMDDYWEVYHMLDPLRSDSKDRVWDKVRGAWDSTPPPLGSDIRTDPKANGSIVMDWDQEGFPNVYESCQGDAPAPEYYHTDPSPYWLSDVSSEESWVNQYYWLGWVFAHPLVPWWYWDPDVVANAASAPSYFFSYEINEGFDTDNDGYGDRAELVDVDASKGRTDPLSDESPIRRRALHLRPGGACARTMSDITTETDPEEFKEWTVECWTRPDNPAAGRLQVIVERSGLVPSGNPMGFPSGIRVNFRLGLDGVGRPFVAYNGHGYDALYHEAKAPIEQALRPNAWYHVAGVYDGVAKELRLFINGEMAAMTPTAEIPFNGYYMPDPNGPLPNADTYFVETPIIVGAADYEPDGWVARYPILVPPAAGLWPGLNMFPIEPNPGDFFTGWVDELRVWHGARSQAEIRSNRFRKMWRDDPDVINGRPPHLVGGEHTPVLHFNFNFDDLPDPQYHGVAPEGYSLLGGYPDGYYTVQWWAYSTYRSRVYDEYRYVPMAEDLVNHVAQDPPKDSPLNVGRTFPNTSNPYSFEYIHATEFLFEHNLLYSQDEMPGRSGLLPMLWAEGDEDIEMWDRGGAPATTKFDTDGDGMDDDWETAYGLDPRDATGNNGADGDIDSDGLSNFYEYLTGNDPTKGDTDGDGINDLNEDADGDGLNNGNELARGTRADDKDTDDDGVSDWEEVTGSTDPVYGATRPETSSGPSKISDPLDPLDPIVRRCMFFNGNARVIVPPQNKLMAEDWAVEAWVYPATNNTKGGVIVSRYVQGLYAGEKAINYEIGLTTNDVASGQFRPYVRYVTPSGETRLDGKGLTDITAGLHAIPIPAGQWSHIAGTMDSVTNRFCLYVNGELAAYRTDASDRPIKVFGYVTDHIGDEVTIGASRSIGPVTNAFKGYLDEVRIWRGTRTADDIWAFYNAPEAVPTDFPTNTVRITNRTISMTPGLCAEIQALPLDQTSHVLARFPAAPTAADLSVLQAAGVKPAFYVTPTVLAVAATPRQLSGVAGLVAATAALQPGDKISARLEVNGAHGPRDVVVQFFPDVSQADALAAAQAVGTPVYGNSFLAGRYMVVLANDAQVSALAANDKVAWIMKSRPSMTSGQPVRLIDNATIGGMEPAPFTTLGEGWDGPGLGSADLLYCFLNYSPDLPQATERQTVSDQFWKWGAVAALTFTETTAAGSSFAIDVGWFVGDHGDGAPFDGPFGVLAHAFFPNDINPEPIAGDLHFDDDEVWTIGGTPTTIDLEYVTLHEGGHSLGLGHSDDPDAVMFPFYDGTQTAELKPDDIDGIQSLYGRPMVSRGGMAEFRFDDGGLSAQDFSVDADWVNRWASAAILDGAVFSVFSLPPLDKDSDGDGMPDWWEIGHGLNPYVGTGGDGPYGDPDRDELVNLYEFFASTDPLDPDSDNDGYNDFNSWSGPVYRTFGEIYSDMDEMPDDWEVNYGLDPGVYDAQGDADGDGWSNYAEYMGNTDPTVTTNFPVPAVKGLVKYDGLAQGDVVIWGYNVASMDGFPVASTTIVEAATGAGTNVAFEISGFHEGDVYLFGFVDADGDGAWGPTEPCGLAERQPLRLSWGDMPGVVIGLHDSATVPWFHPFIWLPPAGVTDFLVEMFNTSQGRLIFTETLRGNTFFHDNNYIYGSPEYAFGLTAGNSYKAVIRDRWYNTIVGSNVFSVVPVTPTVPQNLWPNSESVLIHSRSDMSWVSANRASAFRIQIGRAGESSWLFDKTLAAPWRSVSGQYTMPMPVMLGNGVWTNGLYRWQIRSLVPTNNWSAPATNLFRVNLQMPPSGPAPAISGKVIYFGKANGTNDINNLVVQAFPSSGFSGEPDGQVTLTYRCNTNSPTYEKGPYALMGLYKKVYYVRAFMDMNGNGRPDPWEPQGFADDVNFRPRPLDLSGAANQIVDVRIIMHDRDTDSDNIPDGWEWHYFGTLQYGPSYDPDNDGLGLLDEYINDLYDSNPTLYDSDGDGLSDGAEVALGTNPMTPDTDADGLTDWAEVALGTSPLRADTDNDGLSDGAEVALGTLPLRSDTDGDGASDGAEVLAGTNPLDALSVLFVSRMGASGVGIEIVWDGKAGRVYRVQRSSDMKSWEDIPGGEMSGEGTHVYCDPSAITNPGTYYRVRLKTTE